MAQAETGACIAGALHPLADSGCGIEVNWIDMVMMADSITDVAVNQTDAHATYNDATRYDVGATRPTGPFSTW